MTDTKKLFDAIKEKGYLKKFVAKEAGLSYQGFLNKAKNKTSFTAAEIIKIRKLLQLNEEETALIFLKER